jgi:hypothetical protein
VSAIAAVAAPENVSTVLLNDFKVVHARDSVLFAASNNTVMSALFDTQSRQYRPYDYMELPGPPVRIKRFDSVIVVQSTAGSLSFFRADILPNLSFLGTVNPPTDYLDFAVGGDQLFLACGFEGVRLFTLNGYSGLTPLDSSADPVHAIACEFNQGRLLVIDDYIGVFTYRSSPSRLGAPVDILPLSSPALSIATRNDSVFIGNAGAGISIARIAHDTLSVIGTLPTYFASARIELVDTFVLSFSADGASGDLVSLSGYLNSMWATAGGLFKSGSTFSVEGTSYLVMSTTGGDLMLYDLDRIETDLLQPRPTYPYAGKITDVCIFHDAVVVARRGHPMLAYPLAVTVPPALPVAVFPRFAGVDQVESAGSMLLAYSRDLHSLVTISGAGADYSIESSITGIADEITSFRIADQLLDTSRLLFLLGDRFIDLHTLSPSWEATPPYRLYFPEQPVDAAILDSLILVGTQQSVYVYSINPDFGMTYRSTISLYSSDSNQDPLVRLLPPDAGSTAYPYLIRRNSIASYDLSNVSQPVLVHELDIPVGLTDAVRIGDHIFASSIDRGALRIYFPPLSDPVAMDSIQLVGHSIAVSGSKVAMAGNGVVWLIDWSSPTAIDDDAVASLPVSFELAQNYPNPFNPATTVGYRLFKPSSVSLVVYNLLGQPVRQLVSRHEAVGQYQVSFDGTGLSSGVYFYRLVTEDGSVSRKMALIK